MTHVSSKRVDAQVSRWVWNREPIIDDDVAQTIASYYQSPSQRDFYITKFSHTGVVASYSALLSEIDENGSWLGHPVDLAALRAWAENKLREATTQNLKDTVT